MKPEDDKNSGGGRIIIMIMIRVGSVFLESRRLVEVLVHNICSFGMFIHLVGLNLNVSSC